MIVMVVLATNDPSPSRSKRTAPFGIQGKLPCLGVYIYDPLARSPFQGILSITLYRYHQGKCPLKIGKKYLYTHEKKVAAPPNTRSPHFSLCFVLSTLPRHKSTPWPSIKIPGATYTCLRKRQHVAFVQARTSTLLLILYNTFWERVGIQELSYIECRHPFSGLLLPSSRYHPLAS